MVRFGIVNVKFHKNAQQRGIAEIISHPERKGYYNDIALVRLDHDVTFNYYVRPACLNTCEKCQFERAIASGFGVEEYSKYKCQELLGLLTSRNYEIDKNGTIPASSTHSNH